MNNEPDVEYLTAKQVAERIGVARQTVSVYLWRKSMPEPDLVLLGRPLWLPETIDHWRSQRYVRYRKRRKGRRSRPRLLPTDQPPKNAKLSNLGAKSEFRPAAGVNEVTAREVAAALRGEGHHCTAQDVLDLAQADPDSLVWERRKLQQRVQRKLRGIGERI